MLPLDLKLEEDPPASEQWKLYKVEGAIPSLLCEWHNRKAFVQAWLDGRDDKNFGQILKEFPHILKESKHLNPKQKQRVADWIIDSLFPERLPIEWEDVLCQVVQTFLFKVLVPSFSPPDKELQRELHYTLRSWFALVRDPQRSWFERTPGYSREQAMRDALFNVQGQIQPFYALPGFPELAENFALWFLVHYDLATCAKIHASLYCVRDERQHWWQKLWRPIAHFLFISWGRWVWVLALSVLFILVGLFLPFSGNAALSVPILWIGGILALFPFLVRALLLPRMLGAIGVGYILLLVTTEAWEFAFRIWQDHRTLAFIIFLSSLAASFLYLVVEVGNKVPSRSQRYLCGALVLSIGLAQSLLVGIVSCLLVGSVFMGEVMGRQEGIPAFAKFQVHFHCFSSDLALYPEVVLFFAPVALFIGIFSQILWEEKEITSPL